MGRETQGHDKGDEDGEDNKVMEKREQEVWTGMEKENEGKRDY